MCVAIFFRNRRQIIYMSDAVKMQYTIVGSAVGAANDCPYEP